MNYFCMIILGLAATGNADAAVNCGKVLRDTHIPSCIVTEDSPKSGCGTDPLVKQGERWAGKAQSKDAQNQNGKDVKDCLEMHTRVSPKDRCCRSD